MSVLLSTTAALMPPRRPSNLAMRSLVVIASISEFGVPVEVMPAILTRREKEELEASLSENLRR